MLINAKLIYANQGWLLKKKLKKIKMKKTNVGQEISGSALLKTNDKKGKQQRWPI